MGVTLDSIRQLAVTGAVTLQDDNGVQSVRGATLSQKIGAFFHTDASKVRNAEVVNTLKALVASEPRYVGIHQHAKDLVNSIKADKPIKASRLLEVVDYLDKMSTDEEVIKTCMTRLVGDVSAARVREGGSNSDGRVGIPASLQAAPEATKALYMKTLETTFKSIIENSKTAPNATQRMADIMTAADNARTAFDATIAFTANALQASRLPAEQQEQIMKHVATFNSSQADVTKTIARFEAIQDDALVVADLKSILRSDALGDKDGIQSDADYALNIVSQRNTTLSDAFQASLKEGPAIGRTLLAMGARNVGAVKAGLLITMGRLLNKSVRASTTPLTEDDCKQILQRVYTQYEQMYKDIKTYIPLESQQNMAIIQMERWGDAPQPGLLKDIVDTVKTVDPRLVTKLSRATSYFELDAAIKDLYAKAVETMWPLDYRRFPAGPVREVMVEFLTSYIMAALPQEEQAALIRTFERPEMRNLEAFYIESAIISDATNYCITCEILQRLRATFTGNDKLEPVPVNKDVLPPSVRTQFDSAELFTGDVKPFNPPKMVLGERIATMRNQIFDNRMQASFQDQMRMLYSGVESSFETDIVRRMSVRLPDGTLLPYAFQEARDVLTRFVVHSTDATFDTTSPEDRAKVCVLMAYLSQCFETNIVESSKETLENVGGEYFMALNSQVSNPREFRLMESDNGDIKIDLEATYPIAALDLGTSMSFLAEGSRLHYEGHTTIPQAEFERLSHIDWAAFGTTRLAYIGDKLSTAKDILDPNFNCNSQTTVSAQYHFLRSEDE